MIGEACRWCGEDTASCRSQRARERKLCCPDCDHRPVPVRQIKVQVEVDTASLRYWAQMAAAAGRYGVAHVLYEAAARYEWGDVGVELIAAERRRQVEVEGYTADHDAAHSGRDVVWAAIAYAFAAIFPTHPGHALRFWPWSASTFKVSSSVERSLVKSGALIAAAIDRRRSIGPGNEGDGS